MIYEIQLKRFSLHEPVGTHIVNNSDPKRRQHFLLFLMLNRIKKIKLISISENQWNLT
jgi:hypothetical protein